MSIKSNNSIKFNNYTHISEQRMKRVFTATDKGKAIYMGKLDKFLDLFRGLVGTSKQEELENLWSTLFTPTQSQGVKTDYFPSASTNHSNEDILNLISTFKKIRDLADDISQLKFHIEIENTHIEFKIKNETILGPLELNHNALEEISAELKKGDWNVNFDIFSGVKPAEANPKVNNSETSVQSISYKAETQENNSPVSTHSTYTKEFHLQSLLGVRETLLGITEVEIKKYKTSHRIKFVEAMKQELQKSEIKKQKLTDEIKQLISDITEKKKELEELPLLAIEKIETLEEELKVITDSSYPNYSNRKPRVMAINTEIAKINDQLLISTTTCIELIDGFQQKIHTKVDKKAELATRIDKLNDNLNSEEYLENLTQSNLENYPEYKKLNDKKTNLLKDIRQFSLELQQLSSI